MSYYNENDPYAAEWLRNLVSGGVLEFGMVDDRDIKTIRPEEITSDTAHFFAGIGGWQYALDVAGWPADRAVWTGSCPCQPFSTAGKRKGEDDPRHLWPTWRDLISIERPPVIFGEQVASKDGRTWLSRVRADLEEMGYAFGAADLCAAGIGAPNIRQRLYWVADDGSHGRDEESEMARPGTWEPIPGDGSKDSGLAHAEDSDRRAQQQEEGPWRGRSGSTGVRGMGDADCSELAGWQGESARQEQQAASRAGPWSDGQFIPCTDWKARRTQHGALPLAYGLPRSLGKGSPRAERLRLDAAKAFYKGSLRGYGNAIVPQLAAEFIMAYMEISL